MPPHSTESGCFSRKRPSGARVVWSLLFLVSLVVLGCARPNRAVLVVGMELSYPPFEMLQPNGQPAGISVEMAQALGRFLHRDVQIENIPFDGLIPALKTGKIELIISSLTRTPERAQSIDFSEPYLHTGLALLVSTNALLHSIADADQPGVTIVVKQGTTAQLYAQKQIHRARVLALDKEDACVLEVVQGKAQAFIYDQMSVFKHWQLHRDTTRAVLAPFQQEEWAVGLRKGDKELETQVNAFLRQFRAEGGFNRLAERYLKEQKQAFEQSGIPFYFE